ncbi:MAG: TetR/AcrR family transcriptional regulator, partial [Rhodococcus sp. (in: high G+C Gram-positive bacteria)]
NRENLLSEVFRSVAEYELGVVQRAVDAAGEDPAAQIVALIDTFADRALQGRQMAWSLLFEPVTEGIGNERLSFRRAYCALGERIIRDGVTAEVFVAQHVPVTASAVMGAISEALVGSLSPLAQQNPTSSTPSEVIDEIRHFCLHALSASMSATSR